MVDFTESGMHFSIEDECGCYIEESELYKKLKGKSVSSVECICLSKRNTVQLIEAKSGAARSGEDEQFIILLKSLRKKYEDSLLMIYAVLHGIKNAGLMPIGGKLRTVLENNAHFQFILIIKDRDDDGCIQVRDALYKEMIDILKVMEAEVFVMNEEKARRYRLVR